MGVKTGVIVNQSSFEPYVWWDGSRRTYAQDFVSPAWGQNRPSGLTTITDRQWDPTDPTLGTLPGTGGAVDSYGWAWNGPDTGPKAPLINTPANLSSVIGDPIPSPPDDAQTVLGVAYPQNFPSGNAPVVLTYAAMPLVQQLYICAYVLMPFSYTANSNHNKCWGIQQGGSNNSANHILMLKSGSSDERFAWLLLQGGGEVSGQYNYYGGVQSDAGPPSVPPGANVGPLPTTPSDVRGYNYERQVNRWHMIEWYCKQETVAGVSNDAISKSYVDGKQINGWSGFNFNTSGYATPGFNISNFIPYYGGGGGNAPRNVYWLLGRILWAGA